MDDERDEVAEAREEVAVETTPESNEQAVEQRTDDYDGIVRRLDDIEGMLRERFDALDRALESLGVAAVESGDIADGDVTDAIVEAAAEVVDEILGFDALDLL